MKKTITTIAILTSLGLYAQNNVGIGTLTPNANAKLEIKSNDRGVLITRLTTIARNTLGTALTAAEDGMLVYDKDLTAFYYWDGPNLQWVQVGSGAGDNWGTDIVHTTGANITGDGTTASPLIVTDGDSDATNEIELPATATTGQVLSWDGTNWIAQNAVSGADDWGNDVVNHTGTNITGDGTTASPLTVTDGDSDATNEIELPTGGTNGEVLSTDGSGVYTWVSDQAGTDDQNIANLAFDNTTNILTVGIENGNSQTIDLTSLVNDADSDITNEIQDLSINTTTNILTITNNGSATAIDLSSFLDNTDNQNISGSGLAGTTLTIGIETGTNETVDLSSLVDHDWYKVGTTSAPTNINDNIFTQGIIGVGINTPIVSVHSQGSNFASSAIYVDRIQTTANAGGFFGRHARGTVGSESAAIDGDLAVNFGGVLYDGTNYNTIGMMAFYADGNQTPTNKAGNYRIRLANANGVSSTKMTILSNGNAGIGTTTPSSTTHIKGTTSMTNFPIGIAAAGHVLRVQQAGGQSLFMDGNAIVSDVTTNFCIGNLANAPVYFGTNDQTRMTILGNGNVGIGTTGPSSLLHLNGNGGRTLTIQNSLFPHTNPSSSATIEFTDNSNNTYAYLGDGSSGREFDFVAWHGYDIQLATFSSNTGASYTGSITLVNATGNVGIATQSPTAKLDVVGDLRVRTITAGASTDQSLVVDATGVVKKVAPSSPAGEVITFAGAAAPAGFLMCDGSAVSRTTYANLFAVVGTTYGTGNGSTTFNLPDLRGEFIRGFDAGRGVDAGRGFGSWQKGSLNVGDDGNNLNCLNNGSSGFPENGYDAISATQLQAVYPNSRDIVSQPSSQVGYYYNLGANTYFGVSRPRNIAMNYCIKF